MQYTFSEVISMCPLSRARDEVSQGLVTLLSVAEYLTLCASAWIPAAKRWAVL